MTEGIGYTFEDASRLPELMQKCGGIDRKMVRAVAQQRYDSRVVGEKMLMLLQKAVDNEVW